MRIGMIADLYKPHISGVTNYISLSKQYLEKRGHEVIVFTFGSEAYIDDEPNVIRSPGVPVSATGMHFNLNYSKQARHLLRTMDVVHVHHPFISGPLAIRYCRPYNTPIIFTSHTRYDLYAQAYLPAVADLIGETAIQAYLPAFCRLCDRVIAPSQGMQEVLIRLGVESPIHVVPNGVDLKPFRQIAQTIDRSELGLNQEDVVLVFVGRLGVEKNLAFLLRAFLGVAQAYSNVRLLLVGSGPEKENLQYQLKLVDPTESLVHFTGFVPYDQLPGYLAASDAFVTASVTEVHPLSVIEAMAAGLPVLGISSPGVGDTIRDGITGLLAQDDDIASFTAKMVRLVTSHDERQRMGKQASIDADKYDIENTTGLMIQNYRDVIDKSAERKVSLSKRIFRAFSTKLMMTSNRSIGLWGEAVAADYLVEHGYRILDRNARTPYGEIDLVARQGNVTVFVEVKTRSSVRFGHPETSITDKKRAHMIAASEAYIQNHPELYGDWRLDVIAIERQGEDKVASLVHFENAVC